MSNINELIGLTLSSVEKIGEDRIEFVTVDWKKFVMYHSQDCCESVYIDSIVGDLYDLVGHPILMAEEVCGVIAQPVGWTPSEYCDSSHTWTFYKLATIKGYVDIRWLGESNGYYSESVDFEAA